MGQDEGESVPSEGLAAEPVASEAVSAVQGDAPQQPNDLEMFLAGMLSNSTGMTEELLRENGMRMPGDPEQPRVEERPLLPDEAQLVAERTAVQAVLDDVRARSVAGRLVTPARWAERSLAPAHMDDDAFAAFVFDCLSAEKGAPFDGSGLPVDEEIYPDPRDASDEDEVEADDGAYPNPDTQPCDDAEADGEAPAECVDQAGCPEGELTDDRAPADESPAGSDGTTTEPTDSSEATYVEPAVLEHVHDPLECSDIRTIEGGHDVYLYSADHMSDSYAHWAYLAEEGDDVATLVDNTRQECKIYPRPLLARSLTNDPYNFTLDHVYGVFRQVEESGDYPDIKACSASNGDVYYYSTTYLSTAQAKAMAEWYSVEKPMNV